MPKAEPPQQSKISDAAEAETQQQPENRSRIKGQMMHETNRKPRKKRFAHRVKQSYDYPTFLEAIDQNQHASARLRRLYHAGKRQFGILQVMNDADRKDQIEFVL